MTRASLGLSTILLLLSGVTHAQEPPPAPPPEAAAPTPPVEAAPVAPAKPPAPDWLSRVEIGGNLFLSFRYELTDGSDDFNTFDVTRAYLYATAKPMAHVRLRLTLDAPNREAVVRGSGATTEVVQNAGRFDVILKHAFVELYDIGVQGLSLKFGQQDMPWVPFVEKQWTYRFQGPVPADREGYLSSTDLGLGIAYVLPSKLFEAQVTLVNGETFSRPEVSKHKDVHARVTVRPLPVLPGLGATVFFGEGLYADGDDQTRRRFIAQLAFEHKMGTLAAEYLRAWDPPSALRSRQPSLARSTEAIAKAEGLSAFGWLDLGAVGAPAGVRLVARVDWLDPDADLDDNGHTRLIAGVGYQVNRYINTLLDYETVSYDDGAGADAATAPATESRIFLHGAVGF